jgi:hypothetical protein
LEYNVLRFFFLEPFQIKTKIQRIAFSYLQKSLPLLQISAKNVYLLKNLKKMSVKNTDAPASGNRYWMLFGISLAVMVGLLFTYPEWFWVILPFVCTYFVQAMDWI